jgi:hypothetical protein
MWLSAQRPALNLNHKKCARPQEISKSPTVFSTIGLTSWTNFRCDPTMLAVGLRRKLEQQHNRVVDVSVFFAFIKLNTHYDNHMTGHGKTPCSILQRSWMSSTLVYKLNHNHTLEATNTWMAPDSKRRFTACPALRDNNLFHALTSPQDPCRWYGLYEVGVG